MIVLPNTPLNQWKKFLIQCSDRLLCYYRDLFEFNFPEAENTRALISFIDGLRHDRRVRLPGTKVPFEFNLDSYKLVN